MIFFFKNEGKNEAGHKNNHGASGNYCSFGFIDSNYTYFWPKMGEFHSGLMGFQPFAFFCRRHILPGEVTQDTPPKYHNL